MKSRDKKCKKYFPVREMRHLKLAMGSNLLLENNGWSWHEACC